MQLVQYKSCTCWNILVPHALGSQAGYTTVEKRAIYHILLQMCHVLWQIKKTWAARLHFLWPVKHTDRPSTSAADSVCLYDVCSVVWGSGQSNTLSLTLWWKQGCCSGRSWWLGFNCSFFLFDYMLTAKTFKTTPATDGMNSIKQ